MGRRDNKGERPYHIVYIKGTRRLHDSAATLDGAKARIAFRLSKRHNKGETAEVWLLRAGPAELLYSTGSN